MHFVGSGGFTSALSRQDSPEAIELVSLRTKESRADATPLEGSVASAPDRIAVQAARIQERFRLSAREAEVMELLARGNSVARIAEVLVVSENTVRTHSKRIYTKLDIHKRQELVDRIEAF